MMLESNFFARTPQLDYEAWCDSIRSDYGGDPTVSEPKAFSGWRHALSVCGFPADAIKIECGFGAIDLGYSAHRIERTQREVRRQDVDYYRVLFQVAGRSALIQNNQVVELGGGDVALIDLSRPSTFCNTGSAHGVALHLPRQPLISHLGFEPQGGLYGRSGTLATRALCQLVRDAIEDEASLSGPAGDYMRLAVYDLLGALFAPSGPLPLHTDKLFRRICGIVKDRFADPDFGPCEVAAEAGISLSYLQKLFRARGSTCTHFINSVRLDRAARLLRHRALLDSSQPLSWIAYACGFRDYTHFSRQFRRRFGRAPGAHHAGDQ
jgi:AraC-like DNA-binding protein